MVSHTVVPGAAKGAVPSENRGRHRPLRSSPFEWDTTDASTSWPFPCACAASGGLFHAVFVERTRRVYVLLETVPAEPPGRGSVSVWTTDDSCRTAGDDSRGVTAPRDDGPALFRQGATPRRSAGQDGGGTAPTTFDLSEFDLSDFSCPLCGYGERTPLTGDVQIVKCGKCQELICGMRVSKVRGSLTFRCSDKCGNSRDLDKARGFGRVSGATADSLPSGRTQKPDSPKLPSAPQARLAGGDKVQISRSPIQRRTRLPGRRGAGHPEHSSRMVPVPRR